MAVREVTRLRLEPPEEAQGAPQEADQSAMNVQIIAVMQGLAAILAARFILLVACIGSIGLTVYAERDPTTLSVVTTALYDALVVIPLVVLAWRKA